MKPDLSMFFTTDEEGNEVELTRPETKSWPDVVQCINHHNGKNAAVVERFIELARLGDQWDWFEAYKQWQAECQRLTELNDSRVADEETGELPEPYPLPPEPEQPADQSEHYRELQWRAQREYNQQHAFVTVNDKEFDADWKSIVTMSEAIDASAPGDVLPWVLKPSPAGVADTVTHEELKEALTLARQQYSTLHLKLTKPN